MPKWKKLIDILIDTTASDAERDDAAIDLSNYSNNEIIFALLYTARDNNVDDMIKASCGESLAIIFITINTFRTEIYELLDGISKTEFVNYIKHNKKEWIVNLGNL
ncbi:hypothetical protein GC093_08585 [Paenibacillus sp. LMG 31456]|uniref:Uncharacterized protein n=1 Tax=Paenibacillus foliorum TaxID=2654974 RepID=A0A972GSA1_9BACL|nr:hypothetical protein [Paenibacillus foliorum]NOU93273.1 hypothetical protein [Paenibacillus foliorum]